MLRQICSVGGLAAEYDVSCDTTTHTQGCEEQDTCGSQVAAAIFFVVYIGLGNLILLNIYIDVILDNFGESAVSLPFPRPLQ